MSANTRVSGEWAGLLGRDLSLEAVVGPLTRLSGHPAAEPRRARRL
jgi:hypothetical protein